MLFQILWSWNKTIECAKKKIMELFGAKLNSYFQKKVETDGTVETRLLISTEIESVALFQIGLKAKTPIKLK